MRAIALLTILLCLKSSALGEGTNEYEEGWHQRIGIKVAEEIRQREESILNETRIVGGVIAPAYEHPYLVGLLIDVYGLLSPSACGGSLLTDNRILTAAHCWFDGRSQAWRFTAVLGSRFLFHGGLRVFPNKISLHPQYDHATFANDIAMLYTPNRIPFSYKIKPISLPHEQILEIDLTGHWAKASGYGRYSDAIRPSTNTMARHVWLKMIPLDMCRSFYGNVVLDSNICTNGHGGVGICQGDSGGPLTVTQSDGKTFLIGVSSFVARDGCELGFPSVFARITHYLDWIRSHL